MDYSSHCPYCNKNHTDINNFYVMKNWGACEDCYKKVKKNKKRGSEKHLGKYWSKIRRQDELVKTKKK
jgi:hypothetical protein